MTSKSSLLKALQGSHAILLVTQPAWGATGSSTELIHGKIVADVAKQIGIQLLIFSSLLDVTKESGGRLKLVPHFDQKAHVEEYIREIGVPATFVSPGYFMNNFTLIPLLREGEDGVYSLAYPVGEEAMFPLVDIVRDMGMHASYSDFVHESHVHVRS